MNPENLASPYLSEKEAKRYFQRQEMLLEFSRLFNYDESSDRAVAIVGPAFLDALLSRSTQIADFASIFFNNSPRFKGFVTAL